MEALALQEEAEAHQLLETEVVEVDLQLMVVAVEAEGNLALEVAEEVELLNQVEEVAEEDILEVALLILQHSFH